MHPLQNGSQVETAPNTTSPTGTAGYFTESGVGGAPSWPGADWFNANIKEFQNLLATSGIEFNAMRFDHLARAMKKTTEGVSFLIEQSQFMPFDKTRIYKTGEVFTIERDNKIEFIQWYSNVEHFADIDPFDEANYQSGWTDPTRPFYLVPYTGVESGSVVDWPSESCPESMLIERDVDLPIAVYWRIAERWPELVSDGVINSRDVLGRYKRTSNSTYLLNSTHDDAIRNITGEINLYRKLQANVGSGALAYKNYSSTSYGLGWDPAAGKGAGIISLDASLAVPIAPQNQPISYMSNNAIYV